MNTYCCFQFGPILAYLESETQISGQSKHEMMDVPLLRLIYDRWKRRKLEPRDTIFSVKLSDELPSNTIIRCLVGRYFETYHTIFSLLDETDFKHSLDSLFENPHNSPVHFLIQVVLVLAIANQTYPPDQAPISQSRVHSWVDLASTVPTTALEIGDCSFHILRIIGLINLAKQTLKFNETADYVYSGAGIRYAMMLGTHRTDDAESSGALIWQTIQELDLHACLACGSPPTAPLQKDIRSAVASQKSSTSSPGEGQAVDSSVDLSTNSLRMILSQSMDTRSKIATLVNSEQCLRFEDVMNLSRELCRQMSPISGGADVPQHQQSFAYKYVSFVYYKSLAALHRPFATLNDPGFYLSRDICRSHAQRHQLAVVEAFRDGSLQDPFAALIAGNGTMFRIEAIQSALFLSFELYRCDDYNPYLASLSSSPIYGKAALQELLEHSLGFSEKAIQTHELAGVEFLVLSMVFQHTSLKEKWILGSQQYHHAMFQAGERVGTNFKSLVSLDSYGTSS